MADIITLFCLVHGDNPADRCFPIQITKAVTIGELKVRIKASRERGLQHVDAAELVLWRVHIPIDELSKLDADFNYKTNARIPATKLSPLFEIQDAFPDAPRQKHVHIIVELPPVDERLSRSHTASGLRTPSPTSK